jgi:hypothetical protein
MASQPTTVVITMPVTNTVSAAPNNSTLVIDSPVTTVLTIGQQGPAGPAGPAGGAAVPYIRTTPMDISVGGAVAGTTFTTDVVAALDVILYPYQVPAFTAFGFAQATPLEVGDTIMAGSKLFSWVYTNPLNIVANTLTINDMTAASVIASGIVNTSPVSYTISAVTNTTLGTHTWRVSAIDNTASIFAKDFTVSWLWRTHFGESVLTSLASSDILALRVSAIENNFVGVKACLGGGYKYLCYPASFGLKTTFKDTGTNLDVAMQTAVTVAVTNAFGIVQNYYVHRTLNILGGAINIAVS